METPRVLSFIGPGHDPRCLSGLRSPGGRGCRPRGHPGASTISTPATLLSQRAMRGLSEGPRPPPARLCGCIPPFLSGCWSLLSSGAATVFASGRSAWIRVSWKVRRVFGWKVGLFAGGDMSAYPILFLAQPLCPSERQRISVAPAADSRRQGSGPESNQTNRSKHTPLVRAMPIPRWDGVRSVGNNDGLTLARRRTGVYGPPSVRHARVRIPARES